MISVWLMCGFCAWMGSVMGLYADSQDPFAPKLIVWDFGIVTALAIFLAGGPVGLAFVVCRMWRRK